jgi:hypothetical protein
VFIYRHHQFNHQHPKLRLKKITEKPKQSIYNELKYPQNTKKNNYLVPKPGCKVGKLCPAGKNVW